MSGIEFYLMVLGLCCELCYIKGEKDTIAQLITLDFLSIIVLHHIDVESESLIMLLFLALRGDTDAVILICFCMVTCEILILC